MGIDTDESYPYEGEVILYLDFCCFNAIIVTFLCIERKLRAHT